MVGIILEEIRTRWKQHVGIGEDKWPKTVHN
jgi:hypothetical protein